jgi:hypothetical protein
MNLPTPPPTKIWQDIAAFQRFAEDIQARITDPTQKRMLGDLLQQLTTARAHAQEVVPGALEKLKKEAEAQQAEVPKVQAELERLQAELEATRAEAQKFAEAPRPPTVPDSPIDPNRGQQLAHELRTVFAPARPPEEGAFEDAGSVAREWVETEGDPSDVHPSPHRPATGQPTPPQSSQPRPPIDKETRKGDDIWEGLSRGED